MKSVLSRNGIAATQVAATSGKLVTTRDLILTPIADRFFTSDWDASATHGDGVCAVLRLTGPLEVSGAFSSDFPVE
jgi:hypothetical protein